nr:MFS transporter [Dickeya dadantii]
MLILATVLYAVTGMLPALLDDLGSIVLSRLVFGCAEATIMTCCTTLIADYWHGQERGRFVNLQVVSIGIVGALFFVIGGALGEHSWRLPFYLYLLPLLLVPAMIGVLWEPQVKPRADKNNRRSVSRRCPAPCWPTTCWCLAVWCWRLWCRCKRRRAGAERYHFQHADRAVRRTRPAGITCRFAAVALVSPSCGDRGR